LYQRRVWKQTIKQEQNLASKEKKLGHPKDWKRMKAERNWQTHRKWDKQAEERRAYT
jgi:hypothetical protein